MAADVVVMGGVYKKQLSVIRQSISWSLKCLQITVFSHHAED